MHGIFVAPLFKNTVLKKNIFIREKMVTLCPTGFFVEDSFYSYDNISYMYMGGDRLYLRQSGHDFILSIDVIDMQNVIGLWRKYLQQRHPTHVNTATLEVKLDLLSDDLRSVKEEIRELLNMLKYAPGSQIARETQAHFEGCKTEQTAMKRL
jgi:hypothetical protein